MSQRHQTDRQTDSQPASQQGRQADSKAGRQQGRQTVGDALLVQSVAVPTPDWSGMK